MNLKSNGEKQTVLYRIDEWLKSNIHLFLENYGVYTLDELEKIRSDLNREAENIMIRRRKRYNEKFFENLKEIIRSKTT